jgi:hypothetical protein
MSKPPVCVTHFFRLEVEGQPGCVGTVVSLVEASPANLEVFSKWSKTEKYPRTEGLSPEEEKILQAVLVLAQKGQLTHGMRGRVGTVVEGRTVYALAPENIVTEKVRLSWHGRPSQKREEDSDDECVVQ